MSLPRGRFSTACLLLTATLLSLVAPPSAQAASTCLQPTPRSPLEASHTSAVNPEPSASWCQSTQLGSAASAPSSLSDKTAKGGAGGSPTGKAFTPAGKKKIDAENAAKNDGINKCENCGTEVRRPGIRKGPTMRIDTRAVEYTHGDKAFEGVLAYDGHREGKRPAVLVFHGWEGRSEAQLDFAKKLTDWG